nr:MAG TPA: protein of unknown function UPF0561 [Caudoviricetes sp.]
MCDTCSFCEVIIYHPPINKQLFCLEITFRTLTIQKEKVHNTRYE